MSVLTDFYYNLAVESPLGQVLIDVANESNWLVTQRPLLDTAERISLLPYNNTGLPIVTIALEPDQRWIYFSRVYGAMTGGQQIRVYAIGWQRTVDGENQKYILWVYPSGVVEYALEPTYWKHILGIR